MDFLLAETMIPHRRRMKLIERIKNPDQRRIQTETTVKEGWPMCKRGAVSSIICIELIAQSASAYYTWSRGAGAKPRIGFLVGVKTAEFNTASIPIDVDLTITIDEVSKVGNYGVFKGVVASGHTLYCEAVIQAIDPDEDIVQMINEQKKRI